MQVTNDEMLSAATRDGRVSDAEDAGRCSVERGIGNVKAADQGCPLDHTVV